MSCLIKCHKGQYCCEEGTAGRLAGFTVNTGPIILKVANLPVTDILMLVNKEWVPSGATVGGDVNCVVVRKPGCYRLDILCADYAGPCPEKGCTEVCYECDPSYDSLAALADAVAAGDTAPDVVLDISALVDKLCAIFGEPEPGAPNVLAKLCEIAVSLEANGPLCLKLTALLATLSNDTGDTLFSKMCEVLSVMTDTGPDGLCGKLQAIINNTSAITGIETSLGQVGCVEDEQGNITGSVLVCKVSDTTTGTDTLKVWLFDHATGTVTEDYTGPYKGCTSLAQLDASVQALCAKWDSVICEKPGTTDGESLSYLNDDNTTDITVSLGTNEMKWILDSQNPEPDAVALTEFIKACTEAGSTVSLTWVDTTGVEGTATVTAVTGGTSNYLFQTDGVPTGTDVAKVGARATAVCNNSAEPEHVVKTYDACLLAAIKENTAVAQASLECQKALLEYFTTDKPQCPELIIGAAEFTTDSDNGTTGDEVAFPLTSPLNQTSDIAVPIAMPAELECLNPDTKILVRWQFDHSIEASTNHTGFNVSGNDGTAAVGTIVALSSTGTTNVGPSATPHTGPRDTYWVDIEFTYAQLVAGLALQTSAFGAVNGERETIHSQSVSIQTDLSALGCC